MSRVDRFVAADELLLADAGISQDAEGDDAGVGIRRADLVFYDVDHKRDSYEGRVFFNAPDADESTPKDAEHRYAGSYWVFGHDRCAGDDGHCDPEWGEADDALDYRRVHHSHPHTITMQVSDAVRRIAASTDRVRLTVVAVRAKGLGADENRPLIEFDHVRLVIYA